MQIQYFSLFSQPQLCDTSFSNSQNSHKQVLLYFWTHSNAEG